MLLRSQMVPEPTHGYFDDFWPRVEQRAEGGGEGGNWTGPGSNGKSSDEELVFKASPALQMLNLPERRPETRPQPAVEQASPVVGHVTPLAPPAQQKTSYRWPVAFVMAAAIVTGGVLAYQRMQPPPATPAPSGAPSGEPTAGAAPGSAPAAVATAPAAETQPSGGAGAPASEEQKAGGTEGEAKPEGAAAAEGSRREEASAKRRGKAVKVAARGGAAEGKGGDEGEPASEARPKEKKAKADDEGGEGEAPKKAGKGDALDSLIDSAIGGKAAGAKPKKAAAPAAGAAGDADLPEQLAMNQIRGGMQKVRGNVQACYDKYQIEGTATVKLSIKGDGTVQEVMIKGKFLGTDTGTCVANAVKGARFPKFKGKDMTITYPFLLQ